MRRSPLYVFKSQTSTGIYDVPLDSVIQVIDSDGAGTPSMTQITGKVGIDASTTIDQYLSNPINYDELDRYVDDLDDLDDVQLSATIISGDVLLYNGFHWIDAPASDLVASINLGDLKDVPAPLSGNDGQYLEWDNLTGKWVYVTSVKVLDDLDDVTALNANKDDMLIFDGTKWVQTNIISGGSF